MMQSQTPSSPQERASVALSVIARGMERLNNQLGRLCVAIHELNRTAERPTAPSRKVQP
jgi:hypothetical protein